MIDGPREGDAHGEALRAAAAVHASHNSGREVLEILERSDGAVSAQRVAQWLGPPDGIVGCEQRGLDRVDGRVLDIGAGAGRMSLALQERGLSVTALDTSPGAVEVCAARGVRNTVCSTVDEHAREGQRYDTFALFGANLGLLESRKRAPVFLAALTAMARPGGRIIGASVDTSVSVDPMHLSYQERNRANGRMPGQMRERVRYRDLATPWFDYLRCSVAELEELLADTGWRLAEVDDGDYPFYVATMVLS